MPKTNEIKAIFSLLQSEPDHKEQLKKSLAEFYRENPDKVYALAQEYFGTLPKEIQTLFKENQNNLRQEIERFFYLKKPSVLEGLILLSKKINPQAKRQELTAFLNIAREEFDKVIDSSFEISQKAQCLQEFFFKKLNFAIEDKIKAENYYLPEVFTKLKTTPILMALIYLVFIDPYEVKADIFEAEGKILVRMRDAFSLEPVYIDIAQKGHFIGEDECDMYAAGNFKKWDSKLIIPLTVGEIFKKLFALF